MDLRPSDQSCVDQLTERFEYLFEPDLIKEICKAGSKRFYKRDEVLIDIKDIITHMPLVLSGSIKVLTEDDQGDELLLYYLEYGDTCAVTLNCCTRKSKSTIRAITEQDAELFFIPVEKIEDWMVEFKSWRNFILESFNSRLNEMVGAIDNIVFKNMEERLHKYLRDKAWILKSDTLKISHQDIANDLHSSRVVISRLMKKLEREGIVKQARNKIIFVEFSEK